MQHEICLMEVLKPIRSYGNDNANEMISFFWKIIIVFLLDKKK